MIIVLVFRLGEFKPPIYPVAPLTVKSLLILFLYCLRDSGDQRSRQMIPTGIPVILIGIFLPIFGSRVFGFQTYSAWNHSHHERDILKDWISNFHTKRTVVPAETVKDALVREIVGENVKEKWRDLESRDPPIIRETEESTKEGKSKKIYTFQPDASMTVKEVFNLLQYFPLLFPKDKSITYRIIKIPVDGKIIALKIE